MHIIQIITELEPAGAEKILSELSIELKNKRYTVSVVTLQKLPKNTTILEKLKENKIEIYSLNLSKITPWKIFSLKKLLGEIIEKNNFQNTIVHSHLMHANLACRISKLMGLKIKLINTIHIAEKRRSKKWLFRLDKLTLKYCDIYTAVSSAARDYHSKMLRIDKKYIKVINNGIIPPNKLDHEKIIRLKKEWNFDNCAKIIGSVGRLNKQKGYDIFFDLLFDISKMIPKNETWGVIILGEGKERRNLEEKISLSVLPASPPLSEPDRPGDMASTRPVGTSQGNLPDNIKVTLPGFRNDAAECAGAFDLFVMPSRYEGFGLVLLEAMSHGIPILASSVDSLPELILAYPNGKCIDFENKQFAVRSIFEYISKPKISDYKVQHTQENMVSEYIALYNEMIK